MKAAVHTSYGPPNVVRIAEVDKPTPKDNQVLVKVHATTVNRTDCGFRAGRPFFVRALTGLPRAKGDGPGDRVRRSRGSGGP
jgi:NADPH:quinone reductase-like Zn-dependent oxidoreductase